ncbi:cytoplasmic alpha-amylase [Natronococcus pandeyae]|uniref:Cytoplasmic alpha-amylase n=1 Tax=Natronococcus pandeyae TaxID=2055836 RepID=A0A8J8TS41_9EURY|nr:alpha-amylase domain-containing protein [Natronococcus pandeyae]TYL38152.1 cytoplasmic alpha-amylase [Natronococcus pandeyae]
MVDNDNHGSDSDGVGRRTLLKASATLGALTLAGTSFGSERARAAPEGPDTDEGGEPVLYQYFHTEWSDVEADMQRLADVGVDGIWVPQPAEPKLDWEHQTTEDQEGYYGEAHPYFGYLEPHPPVGYQPVDYRDFDSPYGTETELESMIDAAHDHDIEVVLDIVLNHMATEDGPDGEVELPRFDRDEHFHDYGTLGDDCYWQEEADDEERATYECDLLGLPSFDVEHDYVQSEQAEYVQRMADVGADGLRIDAAGHVWPWYFQYEINPLADDLGLWRVGEIWDGDKETVMEFADTGMTVFDFPLYYAIMDAFEDGDMTALARDEARGIVHEDPDAAVTFVQNHDVSGPNVGVDDEDDPDEYEEEGIEVDLAHAYLLSYEGTPMIFLTAESSAAIDDPHLEDLIWVKRNLAAGRAIDRYVDGGLYVFERETNLLAGINNDEWNDRTEWVETSWTNETLVDYTGNQGEVTTNDDGWVEITVPSQGWVMYAPEGHDDGDDEDDGEGEVTLQMTVEVDHGESVYFTGDADELTDWGGGVEGTWTDGDVWEVTVDDPGEFEWKTRRGPADDTGDVWESGGNHNHTDLHPDHQGWEDE